jgi:flavorubredoxin
VDVSHEKFRSLYMRTLREQLAKAGRSLDYVIVSHTEPDHSGAL